MVHGEYQQSPAQRIMYTLHFKWNSMQTFRLLLTAKCISSEFLTALSSTVCFRREIPVPVEHSASRADSRSLLPRLLLWHCRPCWVCLIINARPCLVSVWTKRKCKEPQTWLCRAHGKWISTASRFWATGSGPRATCHREREGQREGELVGSHWQVL